MLKNRPRATSAATKATTSPSQNSAQQYAADKTMFDSVEKMLQEQYGAIPRDMETLEPIRSQSAASTTRPPTGKT